MLKEAESTAWLIRGGFLDVGGEYQRIIDMKGFKNLIDDELIPVQNVHFLRLPNLRIKLAGQESEIDSQGDFPSF